ncbi:endolytic transglycosylase MltG [Candidatus Gottesmanbacteria bacterium]|nr:endolytic transglycosylase MltG [Candidatus Gottesmanbacteria bacterium]
MRTNLYLQQTNWAFPQGAASSVYMRQKFLVLTGILLGTSFLIFLWWSQAVKPPNPSDNNPKMFIVDRGESARGIAEKLQKQNLIRSAVAFFILARFGGVANIIQAGNFRLTPAMDLYTVSDILTHGTFDIRITIPEGWRNEEIALKLTQELSIPEKEFLKAAREGYMFPDTYLIPKEATAEAVATIFLDNFNKKVTPDIISQANKKNLSSGELITIASLVEREAKFPEDRPLVASVILNRLKIGMKLDIDATVQYVLGYQSMQKSWWKNNLTREDLEIDSLYNTYKHPDLPPTPIANPGLAVIVSVIEAPATDYLYYISDKTGRIHFAKTIQEHNENIRKYLNI